MRCLKRVTSLLCTGVLLVSVAVCTTVPHFPESNHLASRGHNRAFSMQAGEQSCPRIGACEVCQSFQIGLKDFHVCPDDGIDLNDALYSNGDLLIVHALL